MRAAALAVALALCATPARADTPDPPQITVNGEATVSVAPDLALIEGGVTSEAATAREASDINNVVMGRVLLALKSAGIADRDMQTQRLSLQPQFAERNKGPNAIAGYRAGNRIIITLRDLARVAALIDVMVGAGANEIGGVTFTVAEPSKLLDEARVQAVADARRKAEIYARAAAVELGAPVTIAEQGAASPPMYRRAAGMAMAASAPVATGEETLRVSVTMSWTIKGPKP